MSLVLWRVGISLRTIFVAISLFSALSWCQSVVPDTPNQDPPPTSATPAPAAPNDKRILWIIPNFRTAPTLDHYKPLTTNEKFAIAAQDAFDRGTVGLAAIFAGEGQLAQSEKSFGNGAAGYGRYFGTAYADLVIGDFMSEGVYPTLLHQDPRYFRRGTGSGWSRLGYAVGQIFWTHTDSGGTQFNYSEILGNATAVAISQSYYPDSRDAGSATSKLGSQLGVDMASNILKEFWPDIRRKLSRKHQ
jgi:hypothetical protein